MIAPDLERIELRSNQDDFHGLLTTPNGGGVRLLPGEEEQLASATQAVREAPPTDAAGGQASGRVLEVEGALVVSTDFGEMKMPMTSRYEMLPSSTVLATYFDHAETISLRIAFEAQNVNIKLQYVDKPLEAALLSARFYNALISTPGRLLFEAGMVEGGEPATHRFEMGDLPLPVPATKIEEHQDRLRVLEALHEIFLNTGVEIRYPPDSEDEGGLNNLNFVLKAVQGGWVASSVASFTAHIPASEVRAVLEELRQQGRVDKAFLFEVPNEAYEVFGKEVNLGPSRRYLSAARLATSREAMKRWLAQEHGSEELMELIWEPIDDAPMHIFFEEWPTTSLRSVERDLRKFEAIYRVNSERFKQAWEQGEAWIEEIQNGNEWFSLIQAREELMQET